MHPALLQGGDTTLYGSVYKDGIVVACSGVQPDADEGFAGVILALLLMLIQLEAKKQRSSGNDFYQIQ